MMIQDPDELSAMDWQVVKAAMDARMPRKTDAQVSAALEAVHARMDAGAAYNPKSNIRRVVGRVGRGVHSQGSLRRWVAQLKGVDAGEAKSDFGVGGRQLKSWGRWVVGVGALTSAALVAMVVVLKTSNLSILQILDRNRTETREYSAKPGARADIKLADGTGVILAPGTRIKYSVTPSSRHIYLEGEALFTVVHRDGNPFIIHTGGATTRVLGTSFTVHKYPGDATVRVVVAQGRVAFNDVVLGSGEMGIASAIANNSKVSRSRGVDIAAAMAWTEGNLVFQDVPAREVLAEFSRWYDVDIKVESKEIEGRVISIALGAGAAPVHESMQRVCAILAATCEANGRSIIIKH